MRERARRPPRGSCERLDFCIQGPAHLLSHLTIFSRAVSLLHQHLPAISQIHTASSTLTFTQFLSRGRSTVVMSSQPLLQTAPGKTQSTLSHSRPPSNIPQASALRSLPASSPKSSSPTSVPSSHGSTSPSSLAASQLGSSTSATRSARSVLACLRSSPWLQ
jgi:hypothetical protein